MYICELIQSQVQFEYVMRFLFHLFFLFLFALTVVDLFSFYRFHFIYANQKLSVQLKLSLGHFHVISINVNYSLRRTFIYLTFLLFNSSLPFFSFSVERFKTRINERSQPGNYRYRKYSLFNGGMENQTNIRVICVPSNVCKMVCMTLSHK